MSGFLEWWASLLPRFLSWWADLLARWLTLRRRQPSSPIAGLPLRYLIGGASPPPGENGAVVMVPYGSPRAPIGLTAGYCNLFDETNTYDPATNSGLFRPYRRPTATAAEYGEGVPSQEGDGFRRNVVAQLDLRGIQGITIVELDNPDAYPVHDVMMAIDWAQSRGINVLAKNPGLRNLWGESFDQVVAHPNVIGMIVEHGAGIGESMNELRRAAGKPELPVRFVA